MDGMRNCDRSRPIVHEFGLQRDAADGGPPCDADLSIQHAPQRAEGEPEKLRGNRRAGGYCFLKAV